MRLRLSLCAALACASLFPSAACAARTSSVEPAAPLPARVDVLVPSGVVPFEVEVARDDETRARGLMNRDHLDANKGMLFVFDQMERLSFWMKNTLIPLDMIFIDDTGVVVGVVANAEPLTETSRRVDAKSQYVLEVQGGMAEKRGITPGVRVRFEGVPGHPAKASAAVR